MSSLLCNIKMAMTIREKRDLNKVFNVVLAAQIFLLIPVWLFTYFANQGNYEILLKILISFHSVLLLMAFYLIRRLGVPKSASRLSCFLMVIGYSLGPFISLVCIPILAQDLLMGPVSYSGPCTLIARNEVYGLRENKYYYVVTKETSLINIPVTDFEDLGGRRYLEGEQPCSFEVNLVYLARLRAVLEVSAVSTTD